MSKKGPKVEAPKVEAPLETIPKIEGAAYPYKISKDLVSRLEEIREEIASLSAKHLDMDKPVNDALVNLDKAMDWVKFVIKAVSEK